MTSFELLEHTADTGFRVRGASLEELFASAAHALTEIILDPTAVQPLTTVEVMAGGADEGEVLVGFLNEILYLLDGRRLVPARVVVLEVSRGGARAACLCEPRDDSRHAPRLVVKAVTYHQLAVECRDGAWRADVFLDV